MESAAFGKRRGNAAKADTGRAVLRGQFSAARRSGLNAFFPGMEIMLMGFGETQACRVQQQFSAKMAFLLP